MIDNMRIRTVTNDGLIYVCLADIVAAINDAELSVPFFDPALWLRRMAERTETEAQQP